MTPFMLLMPTTPTVTTPKIPSEAKEYKHANKEKVSDNSDTSSQIKIKDKNRDKDVDKSSDANGFEEMMASLLNMPAPAQAQPTTSTQPAVEATTPVTTSVSDAAVPDAVVTPPVLVSSQNTATIPLVDPATGDFSEALLSAMTPGTPAPTADAGTAPVPAPVIAETDPTTLSLTVTKYVASDARLVATGLDASQMQDLKNQVITSQTQAPVLPDDAGIITVTITPEKPPEPVIQAPVVSNLTASTIATATQPQVQTLPQTPTAMPTPTLIPIPPPAPAAEAALTVSAQLLPVDITSDAATPEAPVAVADTTSFDPSEFKIAQKFQRPLASPAPLPANAQPATPTPVATANSNVAVHVDTSIKGKVDTSGVTDNALASTLDATIDATVNPSVTTTPAGIPLAVNTNVLTSPVTQNSSATGSHPAIQTVAAVIAGNAKPGTAQTISMRLDPPDLGKLQIKMKYEKGDPLKVHVVLEKADTAAMFQRDSHALQSALNDAGIQTDGSSLSFEFSQDGSAFQNAMGQDSSGGQSAAQETIVAEASPVETTMDVFTDSNTGLTRYNLRV